LSGWNVLVMMTTLSRGMSYFFKNLPRICSDWPKEYTFAVSKVLMPWSYAYLSCLKDSSSSEIIQSWALP